MIVYLSMIRKCVTRRTVDADSPEICSVGFGVDRSRRVWSSANSSGTTESPDAEAPIYRAAFHQWCVRFNNLREWQLQWWGCRTISQSFARSDKRICQELSGSDNHGQQR